MSSTTKRPKARKKSPVFVARWEVMEDLGVLDPSTIDRRVARGEIPPPVRRVSNNRPVWLRSEWKAWLSRRPGGQPSPSPSPSPSPIQSSDESSSSAR